MAVFEQTISYSYLVTDFIEGIVKKDSKKYFGKKKTVLLKKISEQILIAEDMRESLKKQPTNKIEADLRSSLSTMRQTVNKYIKTLEGLIHGIETSTLTPSQLRFDIQTIVVPLLENFSKSAINFAPKDIDAGSLKEDVERISRNEGPWAALDHYKKTKKRKTEPAKEKLADAAKENLKKIKDDHTRNVLTDLASSITKLPSTLNKGSFSLLRMPVVPDMNYKLLDPEFLNRTNINYEILGDGALVIFRDQVLLAFDSNPLKVKEVDIKKHVSKEAKKRLENHEQNVKHVMFCIEAVNRASTAKYALLSTKFKPNPYKPNIKFAWLMEHTSYKMFTHKSPSGELSKVAWDFPFNETMISLL